MILDSLVNRIVSQLPNKSGQSLDIIEHDKIIKESVATLIDLSRYRISLVISSLISYIEETDKLSNINYHKGESYISTDVLKTQSFLLQLLSVCTQEHWLYCNENDGRSCEQLINPPPLDEILTNRVLNLLLRLIHNFAEPTKEKTTFFTYQTPLHFDKDFSTGAYKDFSVFMSYLNTENTISSIMHSVARTVYYISASNWPIVFSKIKSTISHLTSTVDESSNLYDLQLLGHCALNETRLTAVLSTFQNHFPHFKISTQIYVAIHLRKAIWNWIMAYPKEFKKLQLDHRQLYSNLDKFFDMCNKAAKSIHKKLYFWPLQMDLLILCPNVLKKLIVEMDSNITSKKSYFLTSVKAAIKFNQMSEISVVCYTDICTAISKIDDGTVPSSPLWRLLPEVESGLQQWLLSPIQPYVYGTELVHAGMTIDHQVLMCNADVSLLTISPTYCLKSLKMFYLNSKSPLTAKIIKLNALLHLEQKGDINSSNNHNHRTSPHNDISLEELADSTRKLFYQLTDIYNKQLFHSVYTFTPIPSAPTTKLTNIINLGDAFNINNAIQNIMTLIKLRPQFAFATTESTNAAETEKLLIAITHYLNHPSSSLAEKAASCLLTLHKVDNILSWDKLGYHISTFWKISSQVIFLVSQQILSCPNRKGPELRQLLTFLRQLFISRQRFLNSYQSIAPTEFCSREWLQASIGLEVALLVHLCTSDEYVFEITAECIGLFCEDLQFIEDIGEHELVSLTAIKNIGTYFDISDITYAFQSGRKCYQRKICQILKHMQYRTPGNLAAWEEVWKQWIAILSSTSFHKLYNDGDGMNNNVYVHKSRNSSSYSMHSSSNSSPSIPEQTYSNDDWFLEWESCTYFLASLGQICISVMPDDNYSSFLPPASLAQLSNITTSNENEYQYDVESSHPLDSNGSLLTSKTASNENYADTANKFIKKLIDLLLCESITIRDRVYEIIGVDMSSAFYPKMVELFKMQMDKCFDSNHEPIYASKHTLFVKQAVAVLRMILARKESADELVKIDFSDLIIQFIIYSNGLENDDAGYSIKTKVCKLAEALSNHRNQFGLKKNIDLRMQALDYIIRWNSNSIFIFEKLNNNDNSTYQQPQQQHRYHRRQRSQTKSQEIKVSLSHLYTYSEKLQMELDKASINCLAVTLYQLPLHPTESIPVPDLIQARNDLFNKYFNFFLNILNQISAHEEAKKHDEGALVTEKINRSTLASYKDKIILCLSNLLSSNIDIGLNYALSMVYHNDIQIRIAFVQVLDNILKQGTEFEVLSKTIRSEYYKKLVQLLFKHDCAIVSALCQVCSVADIDDVSIALLASFTSENKTLDLLKIVIQEEINNTDYEDNLFRKTSIATRCWSLFAKLNGNDYKKRILQPVIDQLKNKGDELNFELDTNKIDQGSIETNKDNIINAANLILNAICNSVNLAPIEFRFVCNFIMKATKYRFPKSIYKSVGSFLFLRFFCPALASPDIEGLIEPSEISVKLRRGLLFITKLIQNLANGILFGKKETHLVILNEYMIENISRVTQFLHDMSTVAEGEEFPKDDYPIQMVEEDYHVLQRLLTKYIDDIQNRLISQQYLKIFLDNDSITSREQLIDEINKVLTQLGPPPERTSIVDFNYLQRRKTYSNENPKYREFMLKYRDKNVDIIASKDILYKGGVSKAGRNVLYLIYRRIQRQTTDYELLVYHLFKELEKLAEKPYILLMDMTQFGPQNRLPEPYLQLFMEILPESILTNLANFIVYNPNTYYRNYLNESQSLFHLTSKRATFATTLDEVYAFIDPLELKLPKSTMDLSQEKSIVFSDTTRIWPSNVQTPVLIKITSEFVQIMSMRKQELFHGIRSITNDVYDLAELQVISGTDSQYNQPNRIYLISAIDDTEICIQSLKSKQLFDTILKNKQKYEAVKPSGLSKRIIRPNDVPGRLLNMAFLNLIGDDFKLRLSAYHLLQTLCQKFGYNTFISLLDTKDIYLPANCINMVASISECLALSEEHLTLEFLNEFFIGIVKLTKEQQYLCNLYVIPWIANLENTCSGSLEEIDKTKALISMIIKATFTVDMHKPMQVRLWNALGKVDGVRNMLLESSIEIARYYGIGSKEAECIADSLVTISNVTVRSKLMAHTLRVLRRTVIKPTKSLVDHPLWIEIGILIRFNLMLSFDNRGPLKNYVPDVLHMVTILIGVGPTFIRTSIYGIIVNLIQTLCMSSLVPEINKKELQQLISYTNGKRSQLMYGLVNPCADAFNINSETLSDPLFGNLDLNVLEKMIQTFLRVIELGAPNIDIANAWRSRWLSHITSETFQSNPAIQPRTFIALGYLGDGQIDDNIMYQVLVSLKSALQSFRPDDSYLLVSILKCLRNLVERLDVHSRYLTSLFWIAIGIVAINHPDTICVGMELLNSVLRAMDLGSLFQDEHVIMEEIFLKARAPINDLYQKIDKMCGVNFDEYFSFAVVGLFIKGLWKVPQAKFISNQCLINFLNCATKHPHKTIDSHVLGYVAGLISTAKKMEVNKDMYCFAGMCWQMDKNDNNSHENKDSFNNKSAEKRRLTAINTSASEKGPDINNEQVIFFPTFSENSTIKAIHRRSNTFDEQYPQSDPNGRILFNKLNIYDQKTALLFITCLSAQINISENSSEQNYLYDVLVEAATYMPQVFSIVYPILLNKIYQLMLNTQCLTTLQSIKHILIAFCTDPNIQNPKTNIDDALNQLGFPGLHDASSSISSNDVTTITSILSQIVERFISN